MVKNKDLCEDFILERKREKNRIATQRLRDRKIEYIKQLELKIDSLENENQMLKIKGGELKKKKEENEKLRNAIINSLTQDFYPFLNSENNNLLDEKNPNNII